MLISKKVFKKCQAIMQFATANATRYYLINLNNIMHKKKNELLKIFIYFMVGLNSYYSAIKYIVEYIKNVLS